MRPALVITAVALLIGAAVIYYYSTLPGPFNRDAVVPPPDADTSGDAGGTMSREEEIAVLLGALETVGYGGTLAGATVRETGDGAVFAFGNGREVRVAPPDGFTLQDRFAIPNPASGGFVVENPQGLPLYVNFAHAGRTMEPPDAESGELYRTVAERIAQEGALPFLDEKLTVVSTTAAPRAVHYCLERSDGTRFQGGARFVGPLLVSVMRVGECETDRSRISGHLETAEASLAVNR